MAGIRQPEDERIPVGAPRLPRSPRAPRGRAADATGAALSLIAIFAALGDFAGRQFDIAIAGALVGGFVGLVAGFAGVYWRYREL